MWFLPRNPLPSQRGEMRVGRLKQLDGIVGVWSLITVLVQDNMDTVTPFAKFVRRVPAPTGHRLVQG